MEKAADNGIDVFRIFDALNDVRNLKTSIDAVKKTGKHAQGTICYTISPLHTVEAFAEMAEQLQEMGCDSICIKDMAALLRPQPAYDLVKGIKQRCGQETLVHVHTHATTGVTMVSLMKAIEAGCDIVDTAVSSLSLGPGHNPTESLVEMLEGTGYETRLDMERVVRVSNHFAKIRPRYKEFFSENTGVDTEIFKSQIPGGMISNMESQLKGQGAGDRLQEVLEEVPRVRKDSGYPPLVTPTSQIVGSQAVFNVLMGKYKVLTGEFADLMLGYYGSTIGEKDPEVLKQAEAHAQEAGDHRSPRRLAEAGVGEPERGGECPGRHNGSDEDVLTYAMFPQVAPKFFETRAEGRKNVGKDPAAAKAAEAKAAAGAAAERRQIAERQSELCDYAERQRAQGNRGSGKIEADSLTDRRIQEQEWRKTEIQSRRPWAKRSSNLTPSAREVELGGGKERIEKQHASGKLTARERVARLVDKDSFQEIGLFAQHRSTYFGMAEQRDARRRRGHRMRQDRRPPGASGQPGFHRGRRLGRRGAQRQDCRHDAPVR